MREAEECLSDAVVLAKSIGARGLLAEAYEGLVRLAELGNDQRAALAFCKELLAVRSEARPSVGDYVMAPLRLVTELNVMRAVAERASLAVLVVRSNGEVRFANSAAQTRVHVPTAVSASASLHHILLLKNGASCLIASLM